MTGWVGTAATVRPLSLFLHLPPSLRIRKGILNESLEESLESVRILNESLDSLDHLRILKTVLRILLRILPGIVRIIPRMIREIILGSILRRILRILSRVLRTLLRISPDSS